TEEGSARVVRFAFDVLALAGDDNLVFNTDYPHPRRHLPVGNRAPRRAADPRVEQAEDTVGQRGAGIPARGVTTSGERSLLAATVGTVLFVALVPGTVVVVGASPHELEPRRARSARRRSFRSASRCS